MVAISDSLSHIARYDDVEDWEDNDDEEETEQVKLSIDDKPGWVMGKISKTVQQRMERFLEKQMKFDKLIQLGWENTADYFREGDRTYSSSELKVLAVVKPQTNDDAAAPAPTTFGELMQFLDILPGILQMPQGTPRPGSIYIRLGFGKPLSDTGIAGFVPAVELDLSPIQNVKPIELLNFYLCISPPR